MLAAMFQPATRRRRVLRTAAVLLAWVAGRAGAQAAGSTTQRFRRWHDAAVRMQHLALSWGDQPYGAVLVLGDELLGEGPSRVVQKSDPRAHAEREAIEDAKRRLGFGRGGRALGRQIGMAGAGDRAPRGPACREADT